MSKDQTLPDTPSVTSSQASGDGPMPSNSPVGLQLGLFGREAAPVSPSAPQGREGENPTNGTSGRSSDASSRSVALTWSLANKLRVSLEGRGAAEYGLNWREIPMRWGSSIYQLRASGHRISDSDSTGWPTPNAEHQNDTDSNWEERRAELKEKYGNNGFGMTLSMAASTAGWPTPTTQDDDQDMEKRRIRGAKFGFGEALTLGTAARMGWATPTGRDHKDSSSDGTVPENGLLGRQVWGWNSPRATDGSNGGPNQSGGALSNDAAGSATPPGQTQSGSPSETGSKGVLNPALPLWLQGFHSDWLMVAPVKMSRGSS